MSPLPHQDRPSPAASGGLDRIDRAVLLLLFFAAQATDVKIADIQLFEGLSLILAPWMIYRMRGRLDLAAVAVLGPFLLTALFSSIVAFFMVDFYPPIDIGPMKRPMIISFVRLFQLALTFAVINCLFAVLRNRRDWLWAAAAYIRIALWIASFTHLAYLAARAAGIALPFVYDTATYLALGNHFGSVRERGLFFEGGPYGLSLAAAFGLMFITSAYGRKWSPWAWGNLALALVLSQSKAGFAALFLVLFVFLLYSVSMKLTLGAFAVLSALFIGVATTENPIKNGFLNYADVFVNLASAELISDNADDNQLMGRVAAFVIAPRIVQDRPWFGVGFGNYSLARNNPAYLGPLPPTEHWDLSGLGLFTVLLEDGVVGLAMLLGGYVAFYLMARRRRLPGATRPSFEPLFWLPLILQIAGVQVYFAYHWIFLILWAGAMAHWGESEEAGLPVPGPDGGLQAQS